MPPPALPALLPPVVLVNVVASMAGFLTPSQARRCSGVLLREDMKHRVQWVPKGYSTSIVDM